MASVIIITTITLCFFLTLFFKPLTALSNSSFSFSNFRPNSNINSGYTLFGAANVVNNASSVQLTAPLHSSAGRILYKNPIKFYSGVPKKTVSFSTYFSFSLSSGYGNDDGLAFVVLSNGSFGVLNESNSLKFKFLSVEIDTLMNKFVSFKVVNLSAVNVGLNSGDMLQVWIDYESGSRRLEVRLNRFGENRPANPLLFERIDLSKILVNNEGCYVGLSLINGNTSQVCNVYSWSFTTRKSPDWMHSQPLDPVGFKKGEENEIRVYDKKNDCVVWIVYALIVGIGLGALGSFVGMFMWTIFAKRRPVTPEEYAVKPAVDENKSLSK